MAVALITGPTAGIGHAFADELARKGLDLILVSRDEPRLAATAAELTERYGIGCEIVPADLSDQGDVDRVAALLGSRRVDVLVNNAGFGLSRAFERSDVADEQRVVDVMVTAVMRLTHAAVPGMIDRGFGLVVNVGSMAAWMPGGTYSAAKAWVTSFSESLAVSLAGTGVRVVVSAPGFTRSEFHARAGVDMSALPSWMWLDAAQVVDKAFRDAAVGRTVSVAGPQYRVLHAVLPLVPTSLSRRLMAIRQRNHRLGARH